MDARSAEEQMADAVNKTAACLTEVFCEHVKPAVRCGMGPEDFLSLGETAAATIEDVRKTTLQGGNIEKEHGRQIAYIRREMKRISLIGPFPRRMIIEMTSALDKAMDGVFYPAAQYMRAAQAR